MDRFLMSNLIEWKNKKSRKPLVLNGARQVGKTWLLKEFGKNHFENVAYISLDNNAMARSIFEQDNNINRILDDLAIYTNENIYPNKTLIIIDEIQEQPKAITSLKYFCEDAPEYHVAAAGSLLGLQVHSGTGWPVGKIESLNLYPLNFLEFLNATNNAKLLDKLYSGKINEVSVFRQKLTNLIKQYYLIGGMPEVVKNFIENNNYDSAKKIQVQILQDYRNDFSKHIPEKLIQRTSEVWESIPAHISQENKKFIFGNVRQGARAKDYEESIKWLENAGLVYKVQRINKPGIPLNSYVDNKSFKLFLLDTGILCAMTGVSKDTILEKNTLFTEFKGALTEQYVCQQLISSCNLSTYYWSSPKSSGEIDFLVQQDKNIYAIEVKAAENLKSKSLQAFKEKNVECKCLRFSLADYREQEWMKNIPLYACMLASLWD